MGTDSLKQRLLGALVLLVLALLLWLFLFGTPPGPEVDTRSQIPPAPEFKPFEVPQPRMPADIEPVDTDLIPADEPAPEEFEGNAVAEAGQQPAEKQPAVEPKAETESASTPQLDSRNLPEAWVVQVASLGNASNATQLRQKLLDKGLKAYTETVRTDNGSATRVLVGPKLTRRQADLAKAQIDREFGVDSLVMRFDPNGGR